MTPVRGFLAQPPDTLAAALPRPGPGLPPYLEQRETDTADRWAASDRAVLHEAGHRRGALVTGLHRARARAALGHLEEALDRCEQTRRLFQQAHSATGVALATEALGEIHAAVGHRSTALRHLRLAADIFAQVDPASAERIRRRIAHLDTAAAPSGTEPHPAG